MATALRGARTGLARAAGLLAGATALAWLHLPGRPPTLCLLRAATGIPCPLCGGTTAAAALGHGRFGAALHASPLAVVGAVLLVLVPAVVAVTGRPVALPRDSRKRWAVLACVGVLSELWQLHRFALL